MRLFLYYGLHSLINQIRKLFKTWIMIFLAVCVVMGIVIGLIAGGVASRLDQEENPVQEELVIEEAETIPETEDIDFFEANNITGADVVELIAGGLILVMFLFMAGNADKSGSGIFLPADVNLLFPSPMKPQSVMLFRLAGQLGMALFGSIYMVFQLPNLILNAGLSVGGALSLLVAWGFTIMCGTLLQLLFYVLASKYDVVKKGLRPGIYGIILITAGAFIVYWKQSTEGVFKAAILFFNSSLSRAIPFWGWIKGMCRASVDGDFLMTVLFAGMVIAGMVVAVYLIWHMEVDFYEDAMARSEETAALLEAARSEKNTGVIIKKKDRSEKIRRDEFKHGWGANVFFYKTLYNRLRFAHFGIFTKTAEFYLVVAVAVSLLCRLALHVDSLLPLVCTMGVMVFFRSLGNPLEQDTKMDYFTLIPESTWAKLFWSLTGGTMNCVLDLLPALVVGTVILGANPVWTAVWFLMIVSVDFYATTVGVFIGLSVPGSAGATAKQLVQILFIYFGLIPDIGILAAGIVLGHTGIAVLAGVIINLTLGGLFFGLSPLFIDPCGGKEPAKK